MYNYYDIRKSIEQNNLPQLKKIYAVQPSLFFEDYKDVLESALHSMAAFGNPEMLDWLYSKVKFDIDLSDKGYLSPLGEAAGYGNIATVQWLLSHNAKVDGKDTDLLSPLMCAVMKGYTDIVKLLIEHNANVNRMHRKLGILPLDYAKPFKEIEQLLKSKGAKALSQLPDWVDNPIEGVGILTYITVQLGKIFPLDIENSGNVAIKMVQGSKIKRRVLFTFGLYALQQNKKKLSNLN